MSGIPGERLGETFDTFDLARNPDMGAAFDRCTDVADREAWCAFLTGDYGTGKTHLAIATMHDFGLTRSYFWVVPDYLLWLRSMHFERGFSLDDLTRSYMTGDFLLVFDDYGVHNATEWADEQLYRILNARYNNRLPTILTSNTPPQLLDGRILDRYAEGIVACKGRSQR